VVWGLGCGRGFGFQTYISYSPSQTLRPQLVDSFLLPSERDHGVDEDTAVAV
jgi:hypothetical protein